MKLTRLGLAIPKKSSVEMQQIKLLNSPQQQRRCPSWKEQKLKICRPVMMRLGSYGALRILKEPEVCKDEAKKVVLKIALGRLIGTGSLRENFFD
jgi:hypothetical protein